MKRYFIEEAKCGVTEGGVACGPVGGTVITSIKFKEDGKEPQWLNMAVAGGIPNVYLTDRDVYDEMLAENFENEDFYEWLNDKCFIREFNGIRLDGDYASAYASFYRHPDNPAVPLIRYFIQLTGCATEDMDRMVRMAEGKYADELDLAIGEDEQEYIDELEECGIEDEEDE